MLNFLGLFSVGFGYFLNSIVCLARCIKYVEFSLDSKSAAFPNSLLIMGGPDVQGVLGMNHMQVTLLLFQSLKDLQTLHETKVKHLMVCDLEATYASLFGDKVTKL